MSELLQGVLFVSSVSGLIYRDHDAAGDISCVIVEGKRFYPATITKLTSAMHSDGQGMDVCPTCGCALSAGCKICGKFS